MLAAGAGIWNNLWVLNQDFKRNDVCPPYMGLGNNVVFVYANLKDSTHNLKTDILIPCTFRPEQKAPEKLPISGSIRNTYPL